MHIGYNAAFQSVDKIERSAHCLFGSVFVYALFKQCRGIRVLSQRPCGLSHVIAREFRRLEQNFVRVGFYFAVESAHNAGKCARLVLVANNKVFRIKLELFFVKRCNLFAVFRAADNNFSAGKRS